MFDKQRKHKDFVELLTRRKKEPLSTRPVSIFYASPFGTVMTEYNGPPTAGWRTSSSESAESSPNHHGIVNNDESVNDE